MIRSILLPFLVSLLMVFTALGQGSMSSTSSASTSSSSTNKSGKGPIFRPTKDQIKQVQTMLKDKKLYTGDASGSYNDDTRAGIKSFQKSNGLKETGTLNRATLEKFGVVLTDAQKAIPVSNGSFASTGNSSGPSAAGKSKSSSSDASAKRSAPFRASADQIKAAQKLLKDGKMYAGDQTGKLDDGTRGGLKKYQEANGLKVTGTLNAVTLDKMGITLTDAQKANTTNTASTPAKN